MVNYSGLFRRAARQCQRRELEGLSRSYIEPRDKDVDVSSESMTQ